MSLRDQLLALARHEHSDLTIAVDAADTIASLTTLVASLTAELRDTIAAAAANAQAVLEHDQEEQALVAELDVQAVTIAQLNEMNIVLANKNVRLATTIEALIAERDRLRAALEPFVREFDKHIANLHAEPEAFDWIPHLECLDARDKARAALQEPPHG